MLAAFGVAYLLNFLGYLRERLRWSLLWAAVLLISLTGLLYLLDNAGWLRKNCMKPSVRKAPAAGSGDDLWPDAPL